MNQHVITGHSIKLLQIRVLIECVITVTEIKQIKNNMKTFFKKNNFKIQIKYYSISLAKTIYLL